MKKTSGLVKIILAFALIIGAVSFNSSFAAGQDVEINETNFPAEGFRNYIKKFDTNKNEKLEETEIKAVKKIDLSETENEEGPIKDFKTLKGIEVFSELEELKCDIKWIDELDVSKNLKLKTLNCERNHITNLDVSKNIELVYLNCQNNKLTNLDVTNNKKLETLLCGVNKLGKVDTKENTSLKELSLLATRLKDFDPSVNPNLELLDLSQNELTKINIEKNQKLKVVNFEMNKIKELDFGKNLGLTEINCSSNEFTRVDISKNKDLIRFNCGGNKLTELDIKNNTKLKSLNIGANPITSIDVSHILDLEDLGFGSTKIKEIDVTKNTKLKSIINMSGNLQILDLSKNDKLESVDLAGNNLTSLKMANLGKMRRFYAGDQTYDINIDKKDNSFDLSKLPGKFDPSKVENLKSAKIEGNKLIVDKDAKKVTYSYKLGKDRYLEATLNVKLSGEELGSQRLAGADRIATAIEVSKEEYPSASTVIIARSDIYPDSLAAASISHKLRAPILLTESNKLDDRVKTEIKRLKATNVIIVGGEKSITKDVHDALLEYDKDKNIERIAGNNRYETSAALAKKLVEDLKEAKHAAVIASGENFADALTAGAYAAGEYYPILLVQKDVIDPSIAKVIKSYEINKTIIAGGKMSVSEKVEQELPKDTQRIAGADRYETSAKIADQLFKTQLAYVSSGEVFADALVTSPVAASHKTPILLVSKDKASKEVKDYVKKTIDYFIIVGGEKSVPNSVVLELEKASK